MRGTPKEINNNESEVASPNLYSPVTLDTKKPEATRETNQALKSIFLRDILITLYFYYPIQKILKPRYFVRSSRLFKFYKFIIKTNKS